MSTTPDKKTLYDFTTFITKEVEVETTREEGEGETKKTITEKTKKQEKVPVKIVFRKPTRSQKENCDLDYHAYFFKCMDAGLYTKQQLAKVYKDKGGDLSKGDLDYYIQLQTKLMDKINEVDRWNLKDYSTLNDADKEVVNRARAEYSILRRELIDFESQRSSIFEKTADTKAFHRQVLWYKMELFYKEIDGKLVNLFPGDSFDKKVDAYEEMADNKDELIGNIDGRISAYVTFWLHSGADKKEDFAPIDAELGIKI